MFRSTAIVFASCLPLLLSSVAGADSRSISLISSTEARRYGLEPAWSTRVELDTARGRVTHIQQFVSSKNSHTVYSVRYGDGDRQRVFGERDLNRFGEIVGKVGAQRLADEFVRDLKSRGIEAEVQTQQVPEITLYVTTDRAMVHAIDAETGRTVWAMIVGNPNYPTERPGVSEDYVAVLNGSQLYLLERATGRLIWNRRTHGVPAAGPAVSAHQAVVPTYSGSVELYDLQETRTLPEMYQSNGRAVIQPIVTAFSVVWPTDRGMLYVAQATQHRIRFRLEAKDDIVSQPAFFAPNALFVGSIDGYVYCLQETSGDELWRFSAGEAITDTPVPTGKSLYVMSDKMNLFSIDQQTGQLKWIAPYVKQFIAASKDRLYCLGITDRLEILDADTGARIATTQSTLLNLFYSNPLTDRIIVGTDTGVLQCYREVGQRWPLVHAGAAEAEAAKTRPAIKKETLPPTKPKPGPKPGVPDPFGGDADPFGRGADDDDDPFGGGGADPFGGGADPFGGGGAGGGAADPFGGGGAGGGADPFGGGAAGGGADPFGGGADPFGS